ncbi:aminopeptidase P family protein [Clostridium sp. CS001]|uniref:aminopeptidase P family protein n=1 Tax=Clostridium sp. CS001 TaxID=2880648 RepID=UPI001CF5252C|nr:aminopeptidase P family protein [Clostridium sp. CS001]MCB2291388.1 aminopeptidase P family protein [Clostridium sp. CS001]
MQIKERVESLRKLMVENNIDAYIIPSFDAHQSEYVAEHFKSRQWISGFTGSAGTVVITLDHAILWADGRYYIQAEDQLKGSGIKLFRMVDPGVPTSTEWLKDVLKEGSVIGFDGSVFPVTMVKNMEKEFKKKNLILKMDQDLINELWNDRPAMPKGSIFVHDVKYAGKSRLEKLELTREEMKKNGANYYLLSSLADIAWLLNIRGSDVPNNPVVVSNLVLSEESCYLFVDSSKVPQDVKLELESEGVVLKNYNEIQEFLKGLTSSDEIIFDASKTSANLYNAINPGATKTECPNITTKLKAIKNETEIQNIKCCEVNDGVALVKFIKWLKTSVDKEEITEVSADDKLQGFRKQNELFVGPSFDTIAGYKDHAAMMHYKASSDTQYTLESKGMFLVDSGGQYFNGTTDTTRTIVLGPLTQEEKTDFTLVLKGFIALSSAKFLYGATGSALDVLARQPIWKHGLDYKCGTGHGVGFFLNVHEGPQGFSKVPDTVKLEKGMVITNEPGIYKEGKHGVRIENMILVIEDEKTEYGEFLRFEAITYYPIDLAGIDVAMLDESEKQWLNDYHKDVYAKLAPSLNEEEKAWLLEETKSI